MAKNAVEVGRVSIDEKYVNGEEKYFKFVDTKSSPGEAIVMVTKMHVFQPLPEAEKKRRETEKQKKKEAREKERKKALLAKKAEIEAKIASMA